jgi:peptidoglycan/LPS O-acetylase OafA/YrhL
VFAHTPALDGVRGIAIILVLLHHFTIFDPKTTIDEWIGFVALLGWSGVDLFFVLSGFLITGILIDARGSERYFSSFYARRTLRIFPLYYLVVFILFVVLPLLPRAYELLVGGGTIAQWPYWTYLVNFSIAAHDTFRHGVLDVAWSLAIEEQFYLLWAAIVWLVPLRWLGPLCALLVLGAPAARILALNQAAATPIDVYVLPHFRADTLALGSLLAWLVRRGDHGSVSRAAPWLLTAGIGGVMTAAYLDGSPWWSEPWMQRLGYSAFAVSAAGLVLFGIRPVEKCRAAAILSTGWLRAFGKYSYCMYLVHLPVSRTMQELVMDPAEAPVIMGAAWPAQLGYYVLATLPTFAIGWLSWRAFESPILRLKKRFPY